MHCSLTRIWFALVLRKLHNTLDDKIHFCGKWFVSNATSINVFDDVDNIFDRNLVSESTEPSQICNEIKVISQKLTEQNNARMTQIEELLNGKFELILKENTVYKNHISTSREDPENCLPGLITALGVENETLDDTIIINGDR